MPLCSTVYRSLPLFLALEAFLTIFSPKIKDILLIMHHKGLYYKRWPLSCVLSMRQQPAQQLILRTASPSFLLFPAPWSSQAHALCRRSATRRSFTNKRVDAICFTFYPLLQFIKQTL